MSKPTKCWYCKYLGKCEKLKACNKFSAYNYQSELTYETLATMLDIDVRTLYRYVAVNGPDNVCEFIKKKTGLVVKYVSINDEQTRHKFIYTEND